MASAMVDRWLEQGVWRREEVLASAKSPQSRERAAQSLGISMTGDNRQVAAYGDVLLLGVKPQMLEKVLEEISASIRPGALVISLAAGKRLDWLEQRLSGAKCLRCMPNMAVAVGQAVVALSAGTLVSPEERESVRAWMGALGRAYVVEEVWMDAVVGVAGSAPAYAFVLMEAMADEAVAQGLPRNMALEMAALSLLGAGSLALQGGRHPAQLKDSICSPGGTTIEALRALEQGGFRAAARAAVEAAARKSREL